MRELLIKATRCVPFIFVGDNTKFIEQNEIPLLLILFIMKTSEIKVQSLLTVN